MRLYTTMYYNRQTTVLRPYPNVLLCISYQNNKSEVDKIFSFQKLHVYQLSKDIVKEVYRLTKAFPSSERYGLINQMNRSAISIPSNIAEGSCRDTSKDKIRFLVIAYGSLMEIVCQVEIAHELGYISEEDCTSLTKMCKDLSVKLSNYKNSIKNR